VRPRLDGHDAAIERARQSQLVRDPVAATRNIQYVTPGTPMIPEWDADTAIRWAYIANVFVYRCVQVIANSLSGLPFRAGRDVSKPADWDPGARLAQLLGPPPYGPNPDTSGDELIASAIASYLVTGRFGWEIETTEPSGKGQVVALYELATPHLKAVPSKQGASYFSRFIYGGHGDERVLNPAQVLYAWRRSMLDPRQPESVIQAARLDVSVAVMSDRYDYNFLKNNATPAQIVTTMPAPDDFSRQAWRDQWRDRFGGPDNAGQTLFNEVDPGDRSVGDAIDVRALGLTQKDAEFIKRYDQKVRAICVAFGVPLTVLGDASGRTFANASEEYRVFWTGTMLPIIQRFQNTINLKLAPRLGGEQGWFDLSGVEALRETTEPTTQKVGAPALVQAGIMTVNEARADYGQPPLPGGDELLTPAEAAALQASQPPVQLAASSAPGHERQDPVPPVVTTPEHERALTPEEHEQRRAALWRSTDSIVKGLEATFEKRMRRLFEKQAKAVLSRLEAARSKARRQAERAAPVDVAAVFDLKFWTGETADIGADVFEAIFAAGGARVSAQFGLSFDLQAAYAQEFIEARANQLAGNVSSTTYEAIQVQLSEGAAAGDGIPELAARVQHVFDVATDARATTIARTETISAYNGSATAVASSYGEDVVGGQEWISTVDGRTRPEHAGADGQVVPVGVAFDVGGESMAYPGDPQGSAANVVNCRCTVAFLTPEEMSERGVRPEGRRMTVDQGARVLELVARTRETA
jgi:HK97 family phage portal protein